MVWYGLVWFGMGGGQMTGEFIQEEISMLLFHLEKFSGWVAQAVIHMAQAVM